MRAAYFAKLRYSQAQGLSTAEAEQKRHEHIGALSDNLAALLYQESSGIYKCVDYLSMRKWRLNVYDLLQFSLFELIQCQLKTKVLKVG